MTEGLTTLSVLEDVSARLAHTFADKHATSVIHDVVGQADADLCASIHIEARPEMLMHLARQRLVTMSPTRP